MMISVWTNPTMIFILIGAIRYFVPGEYTENFFIKKSRILECLLLEYLDLRILKIFGGAPFEPPPPG